MTALTLKVQTWSDDLRMPCLIETADTKDLVTHLEPLLRMSIPFQSKYLPTLKRDKWFVLRRPADKVRSGLVVLWPERQACVYISGEPVSTKRPSPRVALLRLRIDPQFMSATAGLTVFAATLSGVARTLTIEDTLVWKGRYVCREEPFSKRWFMCNQWIEHYCIVEPHLLNGLQVEMAAWSPLATVKPDGLWELQVDEANKQRFLWIANQTVSSVPEPPVPVSVAPILEAPVGPLVALANRDVGPEQWVLSSSDGVSLGRALIRTLTISDRLRSLKAKTVRVEVVWVPTFNKWEIKELSEAPIVHSTIFEAAK